MGNYHNPANEISTNGRRLISGSYDYLMEQLQQGEALFACFRNQVPAPVSTHLESPERHAEIETVWSHEVITHYAYPKDKANPGMNWPIP